NILLLVSDDQAWSTFDRDLMPSVFAQLADRGVLFTRAYVNSSLCCPSRSEILTGLYEHHTGVDANRIQLTRPTIVEALHDLGYRTALAGKYLNSVKCDPRPEFDQWMCSGHKPSDYSLRDPFMNVNGTWRTFHGYTVQIQADFISGFIRQTPAGQPFFAVYTPTSPHLPANDGRYASLPVSSIRGPAYDQETRTNAEPLHMRRPPIGPAVARKIDTDHEAMTRAVRALDDSVATLLASLGSREQDTLVIYLSDNGYLYGEHRWGGKQVPYEEAVRVPFIVRYPALHAEWRPTISDALIENVDIAPTIADLVGIPWGADGRSLVPILDGSSSSVREGVLLQQCQGVVGGNEPCYGFYHGPQRTVPAFWGIVTERYKYVEYVTGEEELFDLSSDPNELTNLAGSAAFAGERARLAAALDDLRAPPAVDTTIATGPSGPVHSRVAAFTYFSQSRFASYVCRLNRDGVQGTWHVCNGGSDVEGSLADGSYLFEVAGVDELGVRDLTPATRSFRVSSSGPAVTIDQAPPAHLVPGPVTFSFSSPTPGATFECRLAQLDDESMAWAPCDATSGVTYPAPEPGWWSFEVRAIDPATGAVTDPPAEALLHVDREGPQMTLTTRPPLATAAESASFAFLPDEATAGPVRCRLDRQRTVDCSSGVFEAYGLSPGDHELRIAAEDEAGNRGLTTFEWTVDHTPPNLRVEQAPPAYSNDPVATFGLRRLSSGGGYLCRLDDLVLMMCSQTPSFAGLTDGPHRLTIIAMDFAQNSSSPLELTWVQDTVVPAVTVSGEPAELTNSRSASFTVTGSEPGTFECSFDSAGFTPCASPLTLSELSDGSHTLIVRERDLAGNLSDPVTAAWTVDTSAPTVTIDSGPPDPSTSSPVTFRFSSDEAHVAFSCSLDGTTLLLCESGMTLSALLAGLHTLAVHAVDAAGNVGPEATWTWTVT
ncbi:MAG TPA: sulfatase-like hydrolase/transferase, partial [Actinomycetota bacterium]